MGSESVPKMGTGPVPKTGTERVPKIGTRAQNASGLTFWPATDDSDAVGFTRFGTWFRAYFWGGNLCQ